MKKEKKTVPQSGTGTIRLPEMKKQIISTDPDGSYTGRPADPREIPVQDADDL